MRPVRGQIGVQFLRQRQSHMRAAVDIAMDRFAASYDEAVETTRPHLEHEITRRAVGDGVERAECDPGGRGGQAFVAHAASP